MTSYAYDNLDRPNFVGFGTTAGPTYESTISYTYDVYDRITQAVDSVSGTIARSYDDINRTWSETTAQGLLSYSYDRAGRLTGKSVTGQSAISYIYDSGSRLTSILQGTRNVGFVYDNANRRTSLTLPNGVTTEYGYDNASQLTSQTYKQGSTVLGDLLYERDAVGRRVKVSGSYARTGLPPALASANHNDANQLTQRGSTSLTYDANGNLASDGTNTYTWDARNQLVSISGGVIASFEYDSVGRPNAKTVNGLTTSYL